MIKLTRRFTPLKLTPSFVKIKTEHYKATKEKVWNIDWLKDALKELSYGKCAYCECSLTKESNFMEVEHFEDKHHNPEKVMEWENLLPSCKHCNGHKSTHDVIAEPIVNPFRDNPCDHLYFQHYRYKGRDSKGNTTISVLDLNDGERKMVDTRFEIGNALQESLEVLLVKMDNYNKQPSISHKNRLMGAVYETLRQCQPESEYAALCATVLHSCDEYQILKSGLQQTGLWTQKLDDYDKASRNICLFK
jgi:uncharacterized protein (TIGR02646 family)